MARRRAAGHLGPDMKASLQNKPRASAAEKEPSPEPCTQPGHCPPDGAPVQPHHAIPPRQTRRIPPEAERRAFEDAVNGWWWL